MEKIYEGSIREVVIKIWSRLLRCRTPISYQASWACLGLELDVFHTFASDGGRG
jgi:hypothetical protein